MNLFQRAYRNVTRKLSKTVLLILTFFLIGNLVIIGLGVSNASESAKTLTRQKMRAVVTYSVDYDAVWRYADTIEDEDELDKFYQNYPQVKLADVAEIIKDERVKTANTVSTNTFYQVEGSGIDYVHLNNEAEQNQDSMYGNSTSCYIDDYGNEVCESYRYVEPKFFVKSNMFPSMIEFEDGDWTMVDGRFYNQEEIDSGKLVCLISEALADQNGLRVGDTIALASGYSQGYEKEIGITDEDYNNEFEIIGIYNHNNPVTPDASNYDWMSAYENPDNMILMPGSSAFMATLAYSQKSFDYYAQMYPEEEYYKKENRPSVENMEQYLYLNDVTILLSDPLVVDDFVEDYSTKLAQFMKLDANNEEFNKLAKPLDTLSMYADFIVWLVVINAIVIITLVTALTLKTREYEIGVLLSIGASKFKVIAQFFTELAIVAVLGFTLAVGTGSLIAKKVGATVLEYQIAASDMNEEDEYYYNDDYYSVWDTNYTTEVTLEDLVSQYEVTVSPLIIGEIYVMGLAIVFVSVIIPSFMIMRYNPKKILMNQG